MKAREVRNVLGITNKTINNYIKKGLLNPVKINRTHYEYDENEVYGLLNKGVERKNVSYSRVSTSKQKEDLERQTHRLYEYCVVNNIKLSDQITDIKSGMSFSDRKGLKNIIKDVMEYKIDNVVVENKDRLTRFGFDLLEMFFKRFGTKIIVLSDVQNKSYEQELTDDLISIIHYYSMKSYSHRRKLNNIENILKENDN